MPRKIDAEERAAVIADAALRVLEADGLAGVSVRRVAAEANLAVASLRRAFPTQHELLEFCLRVIEDRVVARIRALTTAGRPRVEDLLAQLLPLDSVRRTELLAQVQLGLMSLTEPALRPAAERLSAAVDQGCRLAIDLLADEGEVHPDRDAEQEAFRLRAVIDGLAMQGLWSGGVRDADRLTDSLSRHLDELARPR